MDDVAFLISTEESRGRTGVYETTERRSQIYCRINSITRSEFAAAGRNGLNPEFELTVFSGDYHGEREIEYHGMRYGIYRSYKVPGTDYVELYAERKGGTNGEQENHC